MRTGSFRDANHTLTHTHVHTYTQIHPSCYHSCIQWVPYQTTIQQQNYTFPVLLFSWQKICTAIYRQRNVVLEMGWCQDDENFLRLLIFSNEREILYLGIQDFWIRRPISGTRRATGDPMVAKWPDFWELFKYYIQTHLNFWIMDLRNSRFLDFWIGRRYLRKELPEICCMYIVRLSPWRTKDEVKEPEGPPTT